MVPLHTHTKKKGDIRCNKYLNVQHTDDRHSQSPLGARANFLFLDLSPTRRPEAFTAISYADLSMAF